MPVRRLLIAGLVVVVVVLGLRAAFTTPSEQSPEPSNVMVPVSLDERSSAPAASPAPPFTIDSSMPDDTALPAADAPSAETGPSSTTFTELSELVVAVRPTMPAVEIVDDGAANAHDHAAETGVGAIAANVVVLAWTWRYDDPADRLRTELQHLANDAVIEQLAPTPDVLSARAAAGEVSWVIVRTVSVDGAVAIVEFGHHLVTSTSAETITTRRAMVTVVDGRAIEVNL